MGLDPKNITFDPWYQTCTLFLRKKRDLVFPIWFTVFLFLCFRRPSFYAIKYLAIYGFGPPKHDFWPLKHNFYCIFTIEMRHCFRLMIYEVLVGFRRPSFQSIKSLGIYRFGPPKHHFWPLLSSESSHLRYFCDRCFLVFSTTFIWIDKKPELDGFGPPKNIFV